MFQDEANPTKVARAGSTSKQMIACFFGKTAHMASVPLEQRRTVNSEWYKKICLPVFFQEIRKTNRRRRITLHHDNASSHKSAQTIAVLRTQNINFRSHPPYSSDVASKDFFLFPYVKNEIRGKRFSINEEAVAAFRMHVLKIPSIRWQKRFDKLVQIHARVYRF